MPPTPESPTGPAAVATPPAGLVVITVDRLPAWIAAPWGATWVATPTLNRLAARGIVFDRVLTPSLDPRHSVHSIFAGAGGAAGLASALASRGWPPAVVTDEPGIVAAAGLSAAAELTTVAAVAAAAVATDVEATNVGRLFAAASRVVAAGGHQAVWCHVGGLGIAWDAPAEFRAAYVDPDDPPPPPGAAVPDMAVAADTDPDLVAGLRHVFAAQVQLFDQALGRFLEAVANRPRGGDWLVLVCGLRGMPLGIHGWIGGRPAAADTEMPYGEVVHVPAVLVDPRGRMAAQRYGGLVIPADVAATMADLVAGTAVRPPLHASAGRSLLPLLTSWHDMPRDRIVIRGPRADALATPGWHAIVPHDGAEPRPLLFAKPDDFFEICDVADREAGVAEEMARVLRAGAGSAPDAAWETPLSSAAVTAAS